VVHAPNNSAAAHWVAGVYTAAKFLPNQDLYLLEAKAKAPTLHQDDTIHSAVMNITTKDRDNTPLTIDFVCPPHSLGGGAHGGTAHLNN
jgi:hypothetical protein